MMFKNALTLLKPYSRQIMTITALAIIISAISAATPFISKNMIDSGLLAGNTRVVVHLVFLIILLQVAGQLIEYLQRKEEINITNDLGKNLKVEAFEHGLKLKPSYFKEQGFFKTISDALFDISNIMMIVNNSFLTVFVIICKCVGALVGLIILDWRLSLFIVAIIPIKLWLNIIVRKHVERSSKQLREDNRSYNSWLSNILSGIIDIKLWDLRKKVVSEYSEHVHTINESSKRLSLLRAKNNLFVTVFECSWVNALYILGAVLIVRERFTFGGLIAFITFSNYVLSPVNIFMELRLIFKQIAPSVEGLKRYHMLEEESYDASLPLVANISAIEFKNVSIAFGGRDILKNFSLKVNRGDKIAVVGENGGGKTTLINLLLRQCEPDAGEILMNGIPISKYNIEDFRRKFSVVSQDFHLFKGTVRENITFDKESDIAFCGDERLRFCTETIESWDEHFNTEVGSEGAKLSGGERQKIALLRALHRKSEILILDEPTSNYDKESEEDFNSFIKENTDYGFYFLITHRKDILANMDKVVTVGDIV